MKDRMKPPNWVLFVVVSMMSVIVSAPSSFATTPKKPISMFYVSLGDSYAAGLQGGPGTPGGYATKVVTDVAPRQTLMLRNFGCGGATTTSMMSALGCSGVLASPGGVSYPTMTQLAAALSFIKSHHHRIGLITITIGGNDLGGTVNNVAPIAKNIARIATQLRAAAGRSVPIVGLTYPDIDLAEWLNGPSGQTIAEESLTAFQEIINPEWKAAYATSKVSFVDVTAASGAYRPLTQLVNDPAYGQIPFAVAQICTLTWMCSVKNIHPTNAGYALIAKQIVHVFLRLAS